MDTPVSVFRLIDVSERSTLIFAPHDDVLTITLWTTGKRIDALSNVPIPALREALQNIRSRPQQTLNLLPRGWLVIRGYECNERYLITFQLGGTTATDTIVCSESEWYASLLCPLEALCPAPAPACIDPVPAPQPAAPAAALSLPPPDDIVDPAQAP